MSYDREHLWRIAGRVTRSLGLELVDAELRGGGKSRRLRITIDKPNGVTHDDCSAVSREVGTILDVEEAIPGGAYTLEVTSPGLDRKLSSAADFERFRGSRVKLMTREPVENNRHWEGRLESFAEGRLTLDVSPQRKKPQAHGPARQVIIELANVERANLVPEI